MGLFQRPKQPKGPRAVEDMKDTATIMAPIPHDGGASARLRIVKAGEYQGREQLKGTSDDHKQLGLVTEPKAYTPGSVGIPEMITKAPSVPEPRAYTPGIPSLTIKKKKKTGRSTYNHANDR